MRRPLRSARRERRHNETVLRPLRPNAGLEALYRARLRKMIEAMHRSVTYWIEANYKAHTPAMAQDRSPAIELRLAVQALARRWMRNFNRGARELARYFAEGAMHQNDETLRRILKQAGFTVVFKMTPAMRDVFQSTVTANVNLIRSIPQQYLGQVEQLVAQSVQTGRDLGQLSKDLQHQFGVTKKRAALIARHQNNMATAVMEDARRKEIGIGEAVWLHSHAGKKPRRTHLANHGNRYDVGKGWYDPDPKVRRRIRPGELINCRCASRSVVPGFS